MSLSRTYSDEFFTTTASKHLDWMESQQFRINPLAEDLLSNAKSASGGLQLEVPWDVQEHSTTTQVTTVLLVLVSQSWPISPALLEALFWLTGGITAISGIHYVSQALWGLAHAHQRQG